MTKEEKQAALEKITEKVAECTSCSLYKQATRSVPGAGNPDAEIVFVGEAPGFHEDQQGLPFVGAAGKLLDKLLVSIDLRREDVFICNMLRHRPPGNRDPFPEEMSACQSFLDDQIKIIDPRILVTLGRFSMNKFLPEVRISQVHGVARFVEFAGKRRIVIPMYHPAAALRNGRIMEAALEDFKKILKFLGELEEQKDTSEEKPSDEQMGLF
ncbi:uracil-DNA glycosylase family protein [Patescibacteria group bacterium]